MTRADRILILLAVCAIPLLYIHIWFSGEPAELAQIRNGNNVPVIETLQPNRMLHISGPLGESIIEINNDRIRFASSPLSLIHI